MRRGRSFAVLVVAAIGACGDSGDTPPPYALQARGGTYSDGSGLRGVAVLATLRDASGTGPGEAWTGTLSDQAGPRGTLTYADGSPGSYGAFWWPEVPFAAGRWRLALRSGDGAVESSFDGADAAPLDVPEVALSSDGAVLSWSPVAGAGGYECRIADAAGLVQAGLGTSTSCGVGGLPDGAYQASVLAHSADLLALAADASERPALPERFDVSEARLAFLRAGSAPAVALAVAGGALDYGLGERTLALWISIFRADGTPTPDAWALSVTGPGIASPIPLTYPASFPRLAAWSYEQPAAPGAYTLVASSAAGALTATFTVGEPAALALPTGIVATDGAQGSARVAWEVVPGARSYLVGVWQGATFVTSQWVAAPPADFPQGSFTPGQIYDVYVAATDADMVGGTRPAQVAVAENTLQPAAFVAR